MSIYAAWNAGGVIHPSAGVTACCDFYLSTARARARSRPRDRVRGLLRAVAPVTGRFFTDSFLADVFFALLFFVLLFFAAIAPSVVIRR
jgi:hypothetical protein